MHPVRRLMVATAASLALTSFAAPPATAEELAVGVFNATSGTFAFGGVPIQNGMRLALEEANQKGLPGGHKIKIVEGDTAADKAQAITLANQFGRRDRVLMIMGPTNSFEAIAAEHPQTIRLRPCRFEAQKGKVVRRRSRPPQAHTRCGSARRPKNTRPCHRN